MNIDQTILHMRDRRRHFKSAVVYVVVAASVVAFHLYAYIRLNGMIDANPNILIGAASCRDMALVWSMVLGVAISSLISEVRRCTWRDVALHLVDRVSELESQIQEPKQDDSEQPNGAVTQESAPGAAP